MALEQFANAPTLSSPLAPWTTLTGTILSGATSLGVASASAFPTSAQYRILIDDELLLVTAGAGTVTWTVSRGLEGTTAATHATGASVAHVLTAASLLRAPGALTTTGDLAYLASSGAPTPLAAGADGTYLRYASGIPTTSAPLMADLSGSGIVYSSDTTLARTGLGTMKLTSSSASTTLGVQNGSNLEYGAIGWSGNTLIVGTQGAVNGGTARDTIIGSATGASNGLYLATQATSRWQVTSSGHIRPVATATYDIGDSSKVVRNVYATLTNATGLPISTGVSGLGTNVATWLATPSSANLASAVTDETGSGALVFATNPTLSGVTMTDATDIVLNTTTGTKIGTATTQKLAFFNSTPVVQPTRGATLTNNVTSGGTDDTIANFTDLTLYVNDSTAIRNDIYQLARIVRQHDIALRALGLAS